MENGYNSVSDEEAEQEQRYEDPNRGVCDNYNYNVDKNCTGYAQSYNESTRNTSPMSVCDYLLTFLIGSIPCAGIIVFIVWACSKEENMNRRNYCIAYFIWMGIALVIGILMWCFVVFLSFSFIS